ncbi:MAG: hypothetical protein ABI587_04965 [Gemmatimonadales bacterium]
MKAKTLLVALLIAGASPLGAQTVIAPPPRLDSTQTAVRDALYRLRDSLQLVDAASASIARDRAMSSDALLRSRASRLMTRCAAAARVVAPTRSVITSAGLPAQDPKLKRAVLLRSLDSLEVGLQSCVTVFERLKSPANAEELRGYGIGRGEKVQSYIRRHDKAVGPYFEAVTGVRYEASRLGAGNVAGTN